MAGQWIMDVTIDVHNVLVNAHQDQGKKMSKVTLAALAGIGAGALGVVMTVSAIKWWKKRKLGSTRSADMYVRPSRKERKLKLYHSFPFRSCRCAWLVNELGVNDYVEFEKVNLHGSDAQDLMRYREVHPHGTLPALKLEDGYVLLESSAICLYLAEVFLDPNEQSLLPDEEHAAHYYE